MQPKRWGQIVTLGDRRLPLTHCEVLANQLYVDNPPAVSPAVRVAGFLHAHRLPELAHISLPTASQLNAQDSIGQLRRALPAGV